MPDSRRINVFMALTLLCGLGAGRPAHAQADAPGAVPSLPGQAPPGAAAAPAPPASAPPGGPGNLSARRFPQSVQAGSLVGRQLLRPVEAQDVLGRVAGLARTPDGSVLLVVRTGRIRGLGGRTVAVPLDAAALLGEHVALLDMEPGQLRTLPDFTGEGTQPVPPDERVRVALTRPFH